MAKAVVLYVPSYRAGLPKEAFSGYRVWETDNLHGAKRYIDGFSIDAFVFGMAMPKHPSEKRAVDTLLQERQETCGMLERGTMEYDEKTRLHRQKDTQDHTITSLINKRAGVELAAYVKKRIWTPGPVMIYSGLDYPLPSQEEVDGADIITKADASTVQEWLADNLRASRRFMRVIRSIAGRKIF
jgi:hypothetical protein